MGVLSGRDIMTSKFITAEITDSEDRIHYVPIKHSIGDFFIADLDGKFFVFTLKNARILTHRVTMTRSFRVIQFDTSHYSSLRPETKELELLLSRNSLPKMNGMLHNVLRVLARREKHEFNPHSIIDLVAEFADQQGQYPEEVRNIKNYLLELDVDTIVTPVRKVTDFIQEDLIATSPSFLGELVPRIQRLDNEHRKITNTPVKGTAGMMKIVIIILMSVIIVVGLVYANDQGIFDGVMSTIDSLGTVGEGLSGLPSPTQGFQTPGVGMDFSDAAIQAQYSPEELQVAVNNGEVDYNKLSSNMKDMLENLEE
tara:strand:- start:434 stop:1369 length:936 start_codon:yes stop_codon:yes gene_type:complete